ncbi:MAG: sigma-70 family RNA polymerase sigma factor [Phycisphaerae bacterium]|nr:sigma-70 family RNA polymerase sigma factor [Phycisphaerae bacterium]
MPPDPQADFTPLVIAAKRGDAAAFSSLYDRFAPMVYAHLLTRLSPPDAEDAVQEVFVSAWQSLHTVRDPGAFVGWLRGVAANRAADIHRRRKSRPALRLEVDPAGSEPRRTEHEDALAVLRTILELPEAYHEPLILRLVAQRSGPQIAAALGMTHGSVRVNLSRGFALLAERLGALKQEVRP